VRPSTTFVRDPSYALIGGADYARDASPAYPPVERLLAELEGGSEALLFSSGMAAAMAALATLRPGDHLVTPRVYYWGLRAALGRFAGRWGVHLTEVDLGDLDALRGALRPGATKLVWVETPANPTLGVVDIEQVAGLAHDAGARVVVDSTVATPVHTRPLELGADLVLHSATKSLNGHGDVVAGVLVTRELGELWRAAREHRRDAGAILGAFEAWLLHRGLRTLFVRVERASSTALELARRLDAHPGVSRVLYPALERHPGHAVAARQMRGGFGSLLSIQVGGGAERALAVASRLELFVRATSLGGVESLVEHRATIEGPSSPAPDDLLRLSIGLEHVDDLWADLERALG
jgi:cystathionine gamma-synthase